MSGSDRFDVVIVGARCSGSALATFLARSGVRVCVVDQARFPSDTPSTHAIQPAGVHILRRLGVLGPPRDAGAAIERVSIALGNARIEVDRISAMAGAPMLNVRRLHLDALLVDAAARAGAEVRTRTPVTDLVTERGRVVGVATKSGVLRARLVVGADGVRSTVARVAGAREYGRTAPGRLFVWGYFEGAGAPTDQVWLGKIDDYGFLGSPTDSGLFMAAVSPSMGRRRTVLADPAASHADGLAHWPELADGLAGARRIGPLRVMPRWRGYFRRSAGPGWVLLGDAGHFKDPTAGQGISDALRQADALAGAVADNLAGADRLDRAMRDWWGWRDRDAWQMYWFAHDMGAAGPTPRLRQHILDRVAADPRLAEGLLRVLNHELPPSKLFTPALALRATATALAAGPHHRLAVLREMATIAGQQAARTRTPRRRRHASPTPFAPADQPDPAPEAG
ncbi:MAG TPA: NAD(P)/FAD-dependent oxidoreductase [Streptosporangiaceae bacterium]|jgi:2-polyprenyl-6-methoxyphenol hydroxylase-like FAD-dependent oxidoreductase